MVIMNLVQFSKLMSLIILNLLQSVTTLEGALSGDSSQKFITITIHYYRLSNEPLLSRPMKISTVFDAKTSTYRKKLFEIRMVAISLSPSCLGWCWLSWIHLLQIQTPGRSL